MKGKIEVNPSKPWLKKDGTELTTLELRLVSKSWNPETWEKYLKTLEFTENAHLMFSESKLDLEEKEYATLGDLLPDHQEIPVDIVALIEEALLSRSLTERERRIVVLFFFEGTSEREISQIYCISRAVVRKLRKRAVLKIKRSLARKLTVRAHQNEVEEGAQTTLLNEGVGK